MLLEAKEQVEHGEWGGWLERNFERSQAQAERYMRLAKSSARRRFSTLTEALGEQSRDGRDDTVCRELIDPCPTDTEDAPALAELHECTDTFRGHQTWSTRSKRVRVRPTTSYLSPRRPVLHGAARKERENFR